MLRVFTKAVGRFRPGDIRDYPRHVWAQIERSAGQPLDRFSRPVEATVEEAVPAGRRRE